MKSKIILIIIIGFLTIDYAHCEVLTLEEKIKIFQELLKSKNYDLRFYALNDNYYHVLNTLETKQQIIDYVSKLDSIYNNYKYSAGFKNLR